MKLVRLERNYSSWSLRASWQAELVQTVVLPGLNGPQHVSRR